MGRTNPVAPTTGVPRRASSKNVSYVEKEEEEFEEGEMSHPRGSARQPSRKRIDFSCDEDEPPRSSTKKYRVCSESSSDETPTIQQSKWYQIATDIRYYDVLLISSNDVKFKSHRSVLSKYSNAFAKIFEDSNEFPVRISMKDYEDKIIKAALDFMLEKYDGIVGKEIPLLKFAVQYEMSDLIKACSDHANKITPTKTNVVKYVQLSNTYNLEELKQKCLKFLSENKKQIDKAVLNGLPQNIIVDVLHF
uniref:BTB domain-containing protein n=1 Tax=Panagrolaimus sp. PS1159 TaxID=55785 RepID=A0AC35F363_9BILA